MGPVFSDRFHAAASSCASRRISAPPADSAGCLFPRPRRLARFATRSSGARCRLKGGPCSCCRAFASTAYADGGGGSWPRPEPRRRWPRPAAAAQIPMPICSCRLARPRHSPPRLPLRRRCPLRLRRLTSRMPVRRLWHRRPRPRSDRLRPPPRWHLRPRQLQHLSSWSRMRLRSLFPIRPPARWPSQSPSQCLSPKSVPSPNLLKPSSPLPPTTTSTSILPRSLSQPPSHSQTQLQPPRRRLRCRRQWGNRFFWLRTPRRLSSTAPAGLKPATSPLRLKLAPGSDH